MGSRVFELPVGEDHPYRASLKVAPLLVARRKSAGLTQTAVAKRLGKPPSYVAKYELGDRRLDVLEYLDIAAAIGFDACEVIRTLLQET
jgi:transcriptional regulator with XRE-family HTH domain